MKTPQIPPLRGMSPLGVKPKAAWIETSTECHLVGEVPELFEAPFNLAGESQSSELTSEGEARVRALAESEARKAQTMFPFHCRRCGTDLPGHPGYERASWRHCPCGHIAINPKGN